MLQVIVLGAWLSIGVLCALGIGGAIFLALDEAPRRGARK